MSRKGYPGPPGPQGSQTPRPPGLGLLLWEGEEPGKGLEGRAGEGRQLTPISEALG